MTKLLFSIPVFILLIAFSCKAKKNNSSQTEKTFTISGNILETHDYCGGAAPPEELQHPLPVGVPGIKLYIKKGNTNSEKTKPFDSIVSGVNGAFSIQLPAGNYCLVEKEKTGKCLVPQNDQSHIWDSVCFVNEFARCDYALEVKSNQKNLNLVFARHCPWNRPCCDYHGPLPPAANPGPKHQE